MSRVLVTGGAGTVGQAVVRRLARDPNWEIRISDARPALDWQREACEIHTGDLRDPTEAAHAIEGCTHVIHLAAIVGGIGNFHRIPWDVLQTNTALIGSVFGAALDARVERLLYVSSSMVFERATEFPTTEEHIHSVSVPRSAYGFSKLQGEIACRALGDQHGLPWTICRPFNAYGPGEIPESEPGIAHVVPDLIRKALQDGSPLEIFGSGEQTRTLTHTDDIAEGIAAALSSPAGENEDFNISAAEELTVAEIARIVWDACDLPPERFELRNVDSFDVDVVRRWPSVEKARRLIGFEARIDVREGIRQTARWLREHEGLGAVR